MKKILLAAVLVAAIVGVMPVFAGGGADKGADSGKIKVTFIAMDSMDEHWLKVKKGCEDKAKELGDVEFTFNAPQGKVDANAQMQLVEDAITRQQNAILLAPLNRDALAPVVDKARKAGIKVVIIDSAVATDYDAFFSTDNGQAARVAADTLGELLGGKGKVAIVNAQAGSATTMTRENDFKAQMASQFPGITIVGTQYSDGDRTKALNIATDFMTANPDLAGFYATNEGSTVGVGNAIEQAKKTGVIKFVGFDWSADTKALIEKKVLDATMVQNPYQMGFQGVQAAVDLVKGKALAKKDVDTGVTVVTWANMGDVQ